MINKTNNEDLISRDEVIKLLNRFKKESLSALRLKHNKELLEYVVDRIIDLINAL